MVVWSSLAMAADHVPSEEMELRPLHQSDSDQPTPLALRQRVKDKICAVDWKKVVVVIIVTFGNFLVFASISLIATFYPTTADDKGSPPFSTGVVVAMAPLAATIFAPVFGYILPKLRIKFAMTGALIIVGVSYIALGVTIYLPSGLPFIITCGVLRFIEGMGTSLYNTSTIVLFAHLYPEKLGAIFGVKQTSSGLGYATGPVIGGFLYLAGGYMTPFFVVGGLCLLFAGPTFLIHTKVPATEISARILPIKTILKVLTNFLGVLLLLAKVCLVAGLGFIVATYALYLKKQFGLTPQRTGLVLLSISVPYVLLAPVGGLIADKLHPRINIILGLAFCSVGFQFIGPTSLLPIHPIFWVSLIGILLIGLGLGVGVVVFPGVYDPISSQLGDTDSLKGIVAGMISSSTAIGELVGPVIGGGLTTALSFGASASIYGEIVLSVVIVIVVASVIHRCTSERTKPEPSSDSTSTTNNGNSDINDQ